MARIFAELRAKMSPAAQARVRTRAKKLRHYLRALGAQPDRRTPARRRAANRLARIERRRRGETVPQEQDRWSAGWTPLTVAELFDR